MDTLDDKPLNTAGYLVDKVSTVLPVDISTSLAFSNRNRNYHLIDTVLSRQQNTKGIAKLILNNKYRRISLADTHIRSRFLSA